MFRLIAQAFTTSTARLSRSLHNPLIIRPQYLIRSFHQTNLLHECLKTKQAAAKRLLKRGGGENYKSICAFLNSICLGQLKYGHAGKSHLNSTKSRKRLRKLNSKVRSFSSLPTTNGDVQIYINFIILKGTLSGVWSKKMQKLLMG